MCTLLLAWQVFEGSPVFLASNRDEKLDRPAVDPLLWNRNPAFVAPRDEVAGGTWVGVNQHGLLVAVTNRFGEQRDDTRQSRGALVVDALGFANASAAADAVRSRPADTYNGFHLLMADEASAHVVVNDGSSVRGYDLEPGLHVVTERSYDAAPNGRAVWLADQVDGLRAESALNPTTLTGLLAHYRADDFDVPTVLSEEFGYGTRSSTTIDVARRAMAHAPGPPHVTAYRDVSDLLSALFG